VKNVPPDYYDRLAAIDERHWWARGLIEIEAELIGPWLERQPRAVLDAGCGTGAFLAWAARRVPRASLAGIDPSTEALAVAQRRVPSADLRVASLSTLPFPDAAFDVVALNDVLQHVDESDVEDGLRELRRVVDRAGCLVVRTNGARRGRRERSDWRLYDKATLRTVLERAGFAVRRVTFANLLFSGAAEVRGRGPRAPTERTCGIPSDPGRVASALGRAALRVEAAIVGAGGAIPWGHTLLAVAVPR
jgi:ubiquinone/menaquinone biosynthesis C-methylase UbiE